MAKKTDERTFPAICYADDGCGKESNIPRKHVEDGGVFNWKCCHCGRSYNLDNIDGPALKKIPVIKETKDDLKFLSAEDLADKDEEMREEHIKRWDLDHHYGLDVVIQPLDTEPEVATVALGVFNTLIGDDPNPSWRELQMAALDARTLAFMLHGYLRPEVAAEDLPPTWWQIFIQWQKMPLKTDTFPVEARSVEEAMEFAQKLCLEENKRSGKVLAVNGVPLEDND